MKSLIVILTALVQIAAAGAQTHNANQASSFIVFDATFYAQKPDLRPFGLEPITIIYSASMWNNKEDRASVPDRNVIRALALQASASPGIAVIDIESWPLTGTAATVAESIQKYQHTIQLFKQSAPSLKIGYYSVVPQRNYGDAVNGSGSRGYIAWQGANDRLASVARLADVLFPSIYTLTKDPVGWRKYAIAQIEEARRIAPGKPVYVFMWPQFEEGRTAVDYLPRDFWSMELETARQYADGVVIWGGWRQTWDNHAPWWLETQSFLKEIGSDK
jgi:Hyaluronidase